YLAAGLAAFDRVHDRKHWPSDVFAGSAIGYFTARAVDALNRNGDGLRVSFQAGPGRGAVIVAVAF
ncbi:MAG: phosphatase PAP2 family protein, partial [Acidobacteria bacterium]|nr:phosphatase PAP2 family protein [Acidobacteriota bacterium]